MSKPTEYPAWRYHKDHEPQMLKSDAEYAKLPGKKEDWHDNVADAGIHMEVYEANGGHQKIRRKRDSEGKLVAIEKEAPAVELESSQGDEVLPEEDLTEKSEDELRAILAERHGIPERKLAKKSREQLLEMFSS